jgi:citrate lyase subunit beta / citryl-CoA lyase
MKLRRSILWVPGNSWDKLHEGLRSEADSIALDLEDLVPPQQKTAARETVKEILKETDFGGKEKIVRINPINTDLGREDIKALVQWKPDAIRLPKCETTEYVLELDRWLSLGEEREKLEKNVIKIILIIETALGIRSAYELASCTKRIVAVGLGAEDLTTDLRTNRSTNGLELMYARQKLVIDGRAAGVDVIDSSSLAIDDPEGLKSETAMVKQLGFDGKSAIHPCQIPIIHEVFSPKMEEIRHAARVIEAYKRGQKEGSFYIFLDGKLIDAPVVKKAERIMAQAQALNLMAPDP